MSFKVSINGQLFDQAEATVSVYDHGLLYGDGVFEGMRSYGGKVFRLQTHVERLYDSAKAIRLAIPITPDEMAAEVNRTLAANEILDGYVRLIVTRGAGPLGIDPNRTSNPQVIVITDHIQLYPPELYDEGLAIVTASTIRNHPAALNPRIKSLNYLNNVLAKLEGLQAGCIEAMMLNHKGEVAECTTENIFIVTRGVLRTPPIEAGILQGITRDVVIELAERANIPVDASPMTRHDVYVADECFLTGSAAEVVPVVRIDERVIGNGAPGPITNQLREAFQREVRA